MSVTWLSASELSKLYARRELSPVEAVDAMLARAAKLQPHLNAFVLIDDGGARAAAKASQERWLKGAPLSPLDGVPTSIKDTTPVKGWPTRYGSHATDETPAAESAPVVDRLQASGLVLLGKTTTPEFGWKALTDSPLHGTTRSPWSLDRSPGGSSGGASALTAAGLNPFNHGNDGGGSIRIPAAHTGLVGLKPSYGRIAQYPADAPFADVVSQGVLSRTRHGAGAECHGRSRSARLALAAGRAARLHDRPGRRCARVEARPQSRSRPCESRSRGARAGRRRSQTFRELGAVVEEVGTLIEPLQNSFEPLWIGSFATRLRQIPSQLHDKLDPGFRAAAEKGLAITLANYAKSYEARSKLARDMALWHRKYDLLRRP